MSKEDDLQQLNVAALRSVTEWLDWQGRVLKKVDAWPKPKHVRFLAEKLTREQVDQLAARYRADPPHYSQNVLANILGLPQKELVLETSSREELRRAMERLERRGTVAIAWRSLPSDDLRDYLRGKCSKEEAAALLWDIKIQPPRSQLRSPAAAAPWSATGAAPAPRDTVPDARPLDRSLLFGQYEVIERLNPGGMAEVFKVRDIASSELRFLKRVPLLSQKVAALRREAQIYGKLMYADLAHVVRVHSVERDDEYMALVTDFADGGTLTDYVRSRDGALSGGATKPIAGHLLTGLEGLHALGIVHRDLKPDNVLLHESIWKLADFGIAKNTAVQSTTTFKAAGTEGYTAPEQFAGAEARTPADVYSFGKVLVFMLTGHTDADRVPHGWRPLVYKCTEREPESRCSLDEVRRELAQLRV